MKDFSRWLRGGTEPEFKDLRAFAQAQAADWPADSNDLQPYLDRVIAAAPPNAPALGAALGQAYERWRSPSGGGGWGQKLLGLFGLVVGLALIAGLAYPPFLQSLAKEEQVRGLITFLFVLTTTGVVILIAIANYWVPKDEVRSRYESAKDLVAILIGVLGTIMGFYFGSQNVSRRSDTPPTPGVTQPAPPTPEVPPAAR